jgi:pyruvate formate lyase activating enzyme
MAIEQRCASIAFTYNEPTISAEFCLEVANVAHQAGIKTIAVTNGYIHGEARSEFFEVMDAANVDIKSINPDFYAKHCGARLEPVLETLTHLARSRRTWLEITNLLIPSLNDSDSDIEALVDWVGTHLGADVPLHFSAFHPAHRTQSLPITPYETLGRAKDRAIARGIRYVYLGNTPQPQITNCPKCKRELIRRTNYVVAKCDVLDGKCPECGAEVAGCF